MTDNPVIRRLAGMEVRPVRHRASGTLAMCMALLDQDGQEIGRLILSKDEAIKFIANCTMVLTIMEADSDPQPVVKDQHKQH